MTERLRESFVKLFRLLDDNIKNALTTSEAPEEIAMGYALLSLLEKRIEPLKESLRTQLLQKAEARGRATEKGGSELMAGGHCILRECRRSSAPDEEKLHALLTGYDIPWTSCFDEVKTLQFNPSKLQYLVDTGRVQAAEVDALHDRKYALKVSLAPELEEVFGSKAKAKKAAGRR